MMESSFNGLLSKNFAGIRIFMTNLIKTNPIFIKNFETLQKDLKYFYFTQKCSNLGLFNQKWSKEIEKQWISTFCSNI